MPDNEVHLRHIDNQHIDSRSLSRLRPPRKFCVNFKRGYTVGYQRGLGIDKPVTFPACPASAKESSGSREAGYLIGFMQGMADGERDWAILGRWVFFHHTSPKLG